MLHVELSAPLPQVHLDRDPKLATVEVPDACCRWDRSNIGAKKVIAFSSRPIARAFASLHS